MYVQPGFNVVHNNPYGQPVTQVHLAPQIQVAPVMPVAAVYVPPPQFTTIAIHESPASPDKETLIRMEVNMIDNHISNGCYAVYNCWLYLVALVGIGLICNYGSRMLNVPSNAVSMTEGILAFGYAFTMINALKNKKLAQVELGFKLALCVALITPVSLYINFSNVYTYSTSSDNAQRTISAFIPYAIFHYLTMIYPIMKIRTHIKQREDALRRLLNN